MTKCVYNTVFFFLVTALMSSAFAQAPPPADTLAMDQAQFKQWLEANTKTPTSANPPPQEGMPLAPLTIPKEQTASLPPAPPPISSRTEEIPAYPAPLNESVPLPHVAGKTSHKVMTYEENQQSMVDSIASISQKPSEESRMAFGALLQRNMPLAPTQVVKLRQQIDLAQRAASVPANIPPKPVSTTLMINLAPGSTPPVIRLAQGYVSSLVFVDSTGTPWPVAAFDIGNPKAVNMQWDGKSNILLIQAVSPYSDGNIVIRLVGLATPITLELVSGQRVVDFRVDIHVSGIGPNTKELPLGTDLPRTANELLLGILDGVGPAGSKLLNVSGADCEAWLLGEKIYLRTRMTVLSPGWIGTMVSPDGMHAYEIPKTSSVLISRYGEPKELKIEGF